MIKSVWNGTLAGQFCCLKKKKKEKEKPSCSFVDCPNVWGSCTCETESYFSLHSSPSPFSTTHFLSLSFSLQLFHHPLSLSLSETQKPEKKRRDGFAELVSSFALYFIEISELVLSFRQSSLALYFIVIVGSIVLSFLQHWGRFLSRSLSLSVSVIS